MSARLERHHWERAWLPQRPDWRLESCGDGRGSYVVTVRFGQRPSETELEAAIETLMRDKAVACAEVWRATDPLEFPLSEEERLRGGDRKIEACLVVETLRVPEPCKLGSRPRGRARTRVARTMPIRTGARGLELDEGCPTFRRRFLQSLGDRTRARGWDAAMSR
jgi:hypothetical protein